MSEKPTEREFSKKLTRSKHITFTAFGAPTAKRRKRRECSFNSEICVYSSNAIGRLALFAFGFIPPTFSICNAERSYRTEHIELSNQFICNCESRFGLQRKSILKSLKFESARARARRESANKCVTIPIEGFERDLMQRQFCACARATTKNLTIKLSEIVK